IEVLLEAHDRKNAVVGEAKPGGPVNAATGTITLKPGEPVQVAVRMNPEYQGKFTLKALNPVTLPTYHSIDLEPDYAVYPHARRPRLEAEQGVRRQGGPQGPAAPDQEGHQRAHLRAGVPARALLREQRSGRDPGRHGGRARDSARELCASRRV